MLLDCAIIGAGPAGLNAALVLARAKKQIVLFDEDQPRNAVTHESHGFITRDGIRPSEFKRIAKEELKKYPSLSIQEQRVIDIKKENHSFTIQTSEGHSYRSKKVILSTGLKDVLPSIEGIEQFYGTSLFSCPFCDGWELRDRPLVVIISEDEHALHYTKMIFNWSQDLVVSTNGKKIFTDEQKALFTKKNIKIIEEKIDSLQGEEGRLQKVRFKNGQEILREGGFVLTGQEQASPLAENLGCTMNKMGGFEVDRFGRTSVEGVYACGDTTFTEPPQLIIAAAKGSMTASGVVNDVIHEEF
ncbi:thioredoxin reductase [Pullulanibacillus pueri]|uniref:FAD/NAD(P)-binding domain-containing protein n=1 Tax=Pullulanibacillus pueri TaxID=1437324 RepID=A0A8J2ZS32_9BACL|nr:NAD(P)/FAD-dependent oxidoreductase [Pullulanibacillus pueri]MBM7679853.1 thioredoxin reductase [Pullulanibacillus pueri]GGH73162.1 hypothetical protein GCM10007096_00110 [Pullulanibacillus pueri]